MLSYSHNYIQQLKAIEIKDIQAYFMKIVLYRNYTFCFIDVTVMCVCSSAIR